MLPGKNFPRHAASTESSARVIRLRENYPWGNFWEWISRIVQFYGVIFHICHFFWDRPTSRPAFPYYSFRDISPGYMLYESFNNNPGDPAQHRTHASAWEIWIFEGEKSTGECISWEISSISKFLNFSSFLMVLRASQAQIRIPGVISCPGMVPDRPGIKFHWKSKMFNFLRWNDNFSLYSTASKNHRIETKPR